MTNQFRWRRASLQVFIAIFVAWTCLLPTAFALNFKPTPMEWATWPEYCRAKYVTGPLGKKSQYAGSVPRAVIDNWRSRLGSTTWDHVHHYCASLAYMQRALAAQSKRDRDFHLRNAEGDCNYTLKRIPRTSPIYKDVAGHYQYVRSVRGTMKSPTG